ncbi:MAG TPA: hypothetical protein VNT55_03705 [Baekduia sp.]|nr:hypothetical protein [Baekduia sp.]
MSTGSCGLIYPVPDPTLPFLGVHLTRKVDGSVWLGPSAILATAREGYARRRIAPRDLGETLAWPGTARLMRRHWRAGVQEIRRALSKSSFVGDAQRYVPALTVADAVRAPAGVRAQAVDRDGALVDDFRLTRGAGVVWVRNAPSPAATSSLAIAEELVAAPTSPSSTPARRIVDATARPLSRHQWWRHGAHPKMGCAPPTPSCRCSRRDDPLR